MIIHIRGKKVRSNSVKRCLNSPECFNYHPKNGKKSIRVTFGFTSEGEKTENYGMMLYHRNRLIKAFERVGYQTQSHNSLGKKVVGLAEVDFLEPIHTKQDFVQNKMFKNAKQWFGKKLNDYWDKNTSRTPSNTKRQRGGRRESQDPATNQTSPEPKKVSIDPPFSVNKSQTQISHSTGGISMVSTDEGRATNNQTDSLLQNTVEPERMVHAQREMIVTQLIEGLKTKINELKTEIDKSNNEEVTMSAAQKIEELKTKINELEKEINEFKHEIKELRKKIDKLETERDESRSEKRYGSKRKKMS